ncbi:Glucose-1-phosphate adenylyltransferase [Planctomycetes bacterium Pan216]|uniref:Glucose-1-phosphate adenylyltransferase n=1 Tax=Kolteria novifilia TaxID=2527975 RepID=A0A518B7D3_9BACT|nr:Glucose-1-phosphate adenylyltransferase [Planctomycetes bacterium Pan216]
MHDLRSDRTTLAIILGGGRGTRLYPLTKVRAKPAVPLGGKYRLIDVPISNCLNSGLNKMYVLTQFESASLHQHVQGSYQFDRFGGGFVEILAAQQRFEAGGWYQGTADAVRQNLVHFGHDWDETLILSGDQLYHMDFQSLLSTHRRTEADITIAALPVTAKEAPSLGIVGVDKNGKINTFTEKPPTEELAGLETDDELFKEFQVQADGRPYLASMGIYVFNHKLLCDELTQHDFVDFGKNLFPEAIKKYRVQVYVFDGYWEDIGTVGSFHEANLALARTPPVFSFNTPRGLIYTRPRTLPGTIAGSISARDSIIADGCVVGDSVLEESVLGIRSIIGTDVKLSRTLVMGADYYETDTELELNRRIGQPDIGIGDNVEIEDAIVDKNARIGSDVIIKNPDKVEPTESPMYTVRDGVICILKGAVIHSGTRIGV